MMDLCDNVNCQLGTSEQHKESTFCRQKRDFTDINLIIDYLASKKPFLGNPRVLRSISTGITAASCVNVDDVVNVGNKISSKMTGSSVQDFTPRRREQCVLMTEKEHPGSKKKMGNIDQNVLFQRMVVVLTSKKEEHSFPSYFKYELSSFPVSLFSSNWNLRDAKKSELAKSIAEMTKYDPSKEEISNEDERKVVLDGGWLLHKIPWKKEESYLSIYEHYYQYVSNKY